ncbi:DUF2510 domain-containing protein [Demequina maris]|uniref:DUF2510 domain-containing protein n=1 Tax=Demequina maris TaxID=1638982 RepID=UPI0007817FF6|nr:DUF2510 domain-containing protein [Demequina maris]
MSEAPIYEITSHIAGKNAKVRVYPDRVEWERGKTVNKGLLIGTMGMSALAGPAGVMSRKGAGTEMIPMRSITSVTTKRDSMLNDVVSIVTSGNTIDMRCSKAEAEQLRSLIMQGINGTLTPAPAAPSAAAAPAATNGFGVNALKARVTQGINDALGSAPAPAPATAPGAVPPPPPPPPAPVDAKPADWYPDPKGEARLRYWDGAAWTDHTAP